MGLDVGVLGAEELLRPVARKVLGDVDELAAAVVAFSRVAFGVLVRQRTPHRLEDGHADEILRGDELELRVLAPDLPGDRGIEFGVGLPYVFHHLCHSSSDWTNHGRTSLMCSETVRRKILSLTRFPVMVPRPP